MADWDEQYLSGTAARYWPNEELVRFLGRTYGPMFEDGKPCLPCIGLNALEVGFGAGANLWALRDYGFTDWGVDVSREACVKAETYLAWRWRTSVQYERLLHLDIASRSNGLLQFKPSSYDLVVDVQCLQHLTSQQRAHVYQEIARILKPGGRFFSVLWAVGDQKHIFPDHPELHTIPWTELIQAYDEAGLEIVESESIRRTYHRFLDCATWYVLTARKA